MRVFGFNEPALVTNGLFVFVERLPELLPLWFLFFF